MEKNKLLIEIFIGLILSYIILTKYFSGERHFENLALGTETFSYQAIDKDSNLIHIIKINHNEENQFVNSLNARGKKDIFLFLGNSQTHAINQKKNTEVNYIQLLFKQNNKKIEILCNSIPNAGLQEFYLSYFYWKNKFSIKTLIIPVFMDDLREDGIRDVFFSNLVKDKFQLDEPNNELSKKINTELRAFWSKNENTKNIDNKEDIAALKETFQEKTEIYFNEYLNKNWRIWQNRQNVRGDFFNWLYKARNTALRINPSTERKQIPQRFEYNLYALKLIVEDCIKSDTKVLLYIPPIRSDVDIPYNMKDYSKFKSTIKNIAFKYKGKVFYRNFEGIIPGNLWGYKESTNLIDEKEIDYMHFQFKGHQILADSLQNAIELIIN